MAILLTGGVSSSSNTRLIKYLMIEKIKQFVNESYQKSIYGSGSIKHFERTVDWLLALKPDADEAMQIAAYAHDIERAFRDEVSEEVFKDREFNDPEFLADHETKGAEIAAKFLRDNGYGDNDVKRVYNMIRYHEEGGDDEANLIKDADSISYLEINAKRHLPLIETLGKEKVKNKIDWMYNRITTEKAKELATPFYDDVIRELYSYFFS